ncbi:MAG: hypothetical protein F8N37_12150 [Telmatospirillum sp.]|nr:hypothetical protein [Telmatospirillum sp.]
MTDTTKILTPDELPPAMKAGFQKIYAFRREIESLKAEHITPLADEVTALWRDLKAGSGMTRKDLDLVYRICERLWLAEAMDDEAEGKRIQADIRRAFAAARAGEIINFLDVLTAPAPQVAEEAGDGGFEGDVAAAEEAIMAEPAPLNLNEAEPRPQVDDHVAGPDADWGDDKLPVPVEEEDGSKDGYAFNLGEKAGLAGDLDIKGLIKKQGWNARSQRAKNCAAGHAVGVKRRQQLELQADRQEDDSAGLNPLPLQNVVNLGAHRPAFPG